MPDDPPWELFDAIPPNIPIIVSDDSDGKLSPPPRDNVWYFDYAAQREYCGEHFAAMPHKSAASRNVGHYIAYKEGFDVIIALDYDCGTRDGLARRPPRSARQGRRGARRCAGDRERVGELDRRRRRLRPGLPLRAAARPSCPASRPTTATGEVKINMGIWDGILDLNGIDKLQAGEPGDPQLASDVQPHRARQHPASAA